jgi:phage anti-repressor protein
LESKQDFSDWIKAKVINNPFFVNNTDYVLLRNSMEQTCNTGRGGHNRKDYAITIDTAKKVAMAEQTARGEDVRNYFLDCEKQRDELVKTMKQAPTLKPPTLHKIASDLSASIKIAKLFGLKGNQALLSANNIVVKRYKDFGVNPLLESGIKLIAKEKMQYLTPSEIGKQHGSLSGRQVNQALANAGFQKETRGQKNKLVWIVTEEGKPHCQMIDTGKQHNGSPIMQIKWKAGVLDECTKSVHL